MIMMSWRIPLLVLVLAVSAGCATQQNSKVSKEDAARFNVQLGMNYMQRGELMEAREKLERAVEQDPSFAGAHAALGILYERVGNVANARARLLRATELDPENPNLINAYAGFLCRHGERGQGMRYFEQAATNAYYRTPEIAWTNAGVCARGVPDLDLAEAFLRRALEANRTYGDALLQLADLKLEAGNSLQARAFLQRYEAVASATPYSLELGRNIELAAGDSAAAREYERRLRREFPQSVEARRLDNE